MSGKENLIILSDIPLEGDLVLEEIIHENINITQCFKRMMLQVEEKLCYNDVIKSISTCNEGIYQVLYRNVRNSINKLVLEYISAKDLIALRVTFVDEATPDWLVPLGKPVVVEDDETLVSEKVIDCSHIAELFELLVDTSFVPYFDI